MKGSFSRSLTQRKISSSSTRTQVVRHRLIENRGAFSKITDPGVEKKEKEKIPTEMSVPLACVLNGWFLWMLNLYV